MKRIRLLTACLLLRQAEAALSLSGYGGIFSAVVQDSIDPRSHIARASTPHTAWQPRDQQRATQRLSVAVPLALFLHFLLLFAAFGSQRNAPSSSSTFSSPWSAAAQFPDKRIVVGRSGIEHSGVVDLADALDKVRRGRASETACTFCVKYHDSD